MFDYIKNRDGKKLFAVIDHPKHKGPYSAVLLLHGFTGYSAERHLVAISDALVEKGMLTVRPDLTKDPGKSYLEYKDLTYGQEVNDSEDVLDYILSMEEVNKNRVGIAGHSLGGMVAAEVASKRKEIKALATLSAVYSSKLQINRIFKKTYEKAMKDFKVKGYTSRWSSTMGKRLKIYKRFGYDFIGRSAGDFVKNINCPTLIISSGADESVSQLQADSYLKNVASQVKRVEIIEGASHTYEGNALDKLTPIVAGWFKQKLI